MTASPRVKYHHRKDTEYSSSFDDLTSSFIPSFTPQLPLQATITAAPETPRSLPFLQSDIANKWADRTGLPHRRFISDEFVSASGDQEPGNLPSPGLSGFVHHRAKRTANYLSEKIKKVGDRLRPKLRSRSTGQSAEWLREQSSGSSVLNQGSAENFNNSGTKSSGAQGHPAVPEVGIFDGAQASIAEPYTRPRLFSLPGHDSTILDRISEHSGERPISQSASIMDISRLRPVSARADPEEKTKCIQDAKDMYQSIVRHAEKANHKVPPYDFIELIGKGAFGRVYKCRNQRTGDLVAIKMTNIDAQDYEGHWAEKENNIRDLKKEISMMQQLKDGNVRNVLAIHEAFDLGPHVWIVSDYCTGGSVRTLLRAIMLLGKGLDERFIIPIARELAVAIKGMHDTGVIHRDIKCSNVYINEHGEIRLGDFGIVGVVEDASSKRKTVVGTLQYMPKEMVLGFLLDENEFEVSYGREVDVWSYGCTLVEMATGHPPNSNRTSPQALAASLENAAPRLEGDQFSPQLRDLVAFCLNDDPKSRPPMEAVLEHPYIANTEVQYPTSNLIELIDKFKIWMHGGGSRTSLWLPSPADARASDEDTSQFDEATDGWNFSTSENFDQSFGLRYSLMFSAHDDVQEFEAPPGAGLPPIRTKDLPVAERIKREHTELSANRGERSLDRLFNPQTPAYKYTPVDETPPQSDLPLRNFTGDAPSRESVVEIDLDAALTGDAGFSDFTFNENTIRPITRKPANDVQDEDDNLASGLADSDDRRNTREWKFPSAAAQAQNRKTLEWTFNTAGNASFNDTTTDFDFDSDSSSGVRPGINRTATEPIGHFRDFSYSRQPAPLSAPPEDRDAITSMIDLDLGLANPADIVRPPTANSAAGSATTEKTSGNPFDLEDESLMNDVDRDRFSYHRQWQSESARGGPDRTQSAAPLHARGHSLSSTDSDRDHPQSGRSSRFGDALNGTTSTYQNSMLDFNFDNNFGPAEQTGTNHWPNFDSPHFNVGNEAAKGGETGYALSQSAMSREPSNGPGDGPVISFPPLEAPHPAALVENADPRLIEEEWNRHLDDLQGSLQSMARVLRQYAQLDDDEDEAELTSDMDSGFDSV